MESAEPDFIAARHGRMETAKLLVDRGASVHAEDDTFCLTPAGWAAWFGHDDVRSYLLETQSG